MKLSPEAWSTLSPLFDAALAREPADRERWLASLAADQSEALRTLLAAHADAEQSGFLGSLPKLEGVPAAATLPAGTNIGGYTIDSLAGRGGMSVVYRAHRSDGTIKRAVALKLLQSGPLTAGSLARFSRERDILAALNHPHIAHLYDAGVDVAGQPYLAMEFVEGQPIDAWCDGRTLGVRERVGVVLDALDAVQYAHSQLVVHRDIKPSNLLVTAGGGVKLLDFGIARLLADAGPDETLLTQHGTLPMTTSYASPEQVQGLPVGTATDVYSLGVLLHVLLTGALPYRGAPTSRQAIEAAIVSEDRWRPSVAPLTTEAAAARGCSSSRLAGQLRGDLDTIVLKALRRDPRERYATVQALRDDLARYLAGEAVLARPTSVGYRMRKLITRYPWQAAAAGLVVLALAAFTVGLGVQLRLVTQERNRADQIARFMTHVFDAADPSTERTNPVTARELLDNASAQVEADSTLVPLQRALIVQDMARSYANLGEYAQAESLLQRQLAAVESGPASDRLALVILRNEQMWDYYLARDMEKSSLVGHQLLADERRWLGAQDPHTALTETMLSSAVTWQGDFAEAATLMEHGLRYIGKMGQENPREAADDAADLAYFRFRAGTGAARDAEEKMQALLDNYRATYGPLHFITISAVNRLGVILAREGKYAQEVAVYQALLDQAEREHRDTLDPVIDIRGNLAAALIHVGQLAAAEQHLQKTEQLLLASGASQNFRIALGEYNLACVQARQGKKDMAIETLRRSLDHGLLADAALHMDADDDLVSLQADVRFKALLARAHLMYPAPAAPGNP